MACPACPAVAQLGRPQAGGAGRIKDFEVLRIPSGVSTNDSSLLCITASSDGVVRIWSLDLHSLSLSNNPKTPASVFNASTVKPVPDGIAREPRQVGTLIGSHETGNRIICLTAFVMDEGADGEMDGAGEEFGGLSDHEDGNSVSSDEED